MVGRPKYIPSTARPVGRGLGEWKQQMLQERLPLWEINPQQAAALRGIHLEIGYGSGEHLIHRAKQQSNTVFIGCEVFLHGIAYCLKAMGQENISNVRLFTQDARLLLDALPDASLARAYILFPDPWPKPRHFKRRIVNQETLSLLHRVLAPGAELRLATDHPGYAEWMLVQLQAHGGFRWQANCKEDWTMPPEGHTKTRYEEKLKAGHEPVFLSFVRN